MIDQQTHRSFPVLGIDLSDPTGDDVKMTGVHVGPPTEPRGVRVKREAADEDDITVVPPPEAPVSEAEGSTEDDMSVDEHRNKDTRRTRRAPRRTRIPAMRTTTRSSATRARRTRRAPRRMRIPAMRTTRSPATRARSTRRPAMTTTSARRSRCEQEHRHTTRPPSPPRRGRKKGTLAVPELLQHWPVSMHELV